jgi:hypothetical protein
MVTLLCPFIKWWLNIKILHYSTEKTILEAKGKWDQDTSDWLDDDIRRAGRRTVDTGAYCGIIQAATSHTDMLKGRRTHVNVKQIKGVSTQRI